jgi:RNA polymerase sigma-70 factor (ECF subfamily)
VNDIDPALVARAQAGDDDAIRALIERLHRPVLATVHRFLGSRFRADVEDVAQEIFLKVFRAIERFDPARGVKFTTWVYTFVRNHCFDVLKRRRLLTVPLAGGDADDRPIDPADEHSPEGPREISNQELGQQIEQALDALGPDQRLAFVLREYEGLDYARIAEITEVSEGTVKSRIHRAKEALRKQLTPYVGTETWQTGS